MAKPQSSSLERLFRPPPVEPEPPASPGPAAPTEADYLHAFFNHSPDLHCVIGADGFPQHVNPAWTFLLGYADTELLGQPLVEIVHPDDRPAFLEGLSRLGRGEDVNGLEVRCVAKDESQHWILWQATPLAVPPLVIASGCDITARKLQEAAVLQSERHYRELFHQSCQHRENLRKMSDCVLRLLEHERSRISRDLHEQIAQALMIISMNLGSLRNGLGPASADTEQRINDTQRIVEQTMINVHNFSRELRPAMLDDLGLVPTLRNYVKHFTERTGLPIRLDVTQAERIERLDPERKTVVYRIIQEGLENVAKHAQASQVEIIIAGSAKDVRLQLGDDGQGFPAQATASPGPQLGLLGLAERVRLVGGEFAITSLPEKGTLLRATISF